MKDDESSTAYQLTPPVDFRAAVDQLGDNHLIVDSERMLVTFRNAVLNLEVVGGSGVC